VVIENLIVGILVALSAWVVGKKLRASLGFGASKENGAGCASDCGSAPKEPVYGEKLISLPTKKK
tara:strand:+ start:49 stop:243 length:195 start_codon:yes stop_codon:yes gene_type:complete